MPIKNICYILINKNECIQLVHCVFKITSQPLSVSVIHGTDYTNFSTDFLTHFFGNNDFFLLFFSGNTCAATQMSKPARRN